MLGIIILGIVQGIAEFLPISSSAHLIIFRDVFNVGKSVTENIALSFDIALHLGTLLAIIVYFLKDFLNMVIKGLTKGIKDNEGKIFYFLIIATIPAAIAGLVFEDVIENLIRGNLIVIAVALAVMGIIIYLVDKNQKTDKTISDLTITDVLLIGTSQIFALIPGFSRSGTTITASRILNLNREESAKFSFYLSAPVVLGAVILTFLKGETMTAISSNLSIFIVGILVSFIVGLITIKYLLQYLKKHDFKIFMWYRLLLAFIV
ncbi:MAG: undecaprenyl-diphosphatase UppP, partial [Bacilli bacterium]|nr:undecaprenyl-diphosphatase UppP [Bacilli bacterium]